MRRHAFLGLALSLVGASLACSEDVLIGLDRPDGGGLASGSGGTAASGGTDAGGGGDASGNGGASGSGASIATGGSAGTTASAGTAGAAVACSAVKCGNAIFACGDCMDNDGDGLIDADDPECLGPCDNTEISLMLGLPGSDAGTCSADCAFDRGASRNDGCVYSYQCDQKSLGPSYPPTGRSKCEYDESATLPGSNVTCAEMRADQPQICKDVCLTLAPNGCDCFGCCELPGRSGRFVWVGGDGGELAGCDLGTLDDPAICPPCTPVPSCFNECEECEYCAGGVTPDPSCGGVVSECDGGRLSCTGRTSCPSGSYCITGCCVPEPA